jgi:hypothetical protein
MSHQNVTRHLELAVDQLDEALEHLTDADAYDSPDLAPAARAPLGVAIDKTKQALEFARAALVDQRDTHG